MKQIKNYKLFNEDCLKGLLRLSNESVDVILTDPPYKYLKNQKLEVDFDETAYFNQVNRVLKKGGFVVLFGRGSSFYRWNTMLADLGFGFKEEIIWDKLQCSSPLMALGRVHETVSIHCKGKGKINKLKLPYLEIREYNLKGIVDDVKSLKTVLNNTKKLELILEYLELREGEEVLYSEIKKEKHSTTQSSSIKSQNRQVAVIRSISEGMNEKSIIKQYRDHFTAIHPTQKPVRLLERLLGLVRPMRSGKVVVVDSFAGSFSTCEAVDNLAIENPENTFEFWGWELDKEYYDDGVARIQAKIHVHEG